MTIFYKKVLTKSGEVCSEEVRDLGRGPIIFGSSRDCGLVFESKLVSSRHGELQLEGSQLFCKDLDSLGGVRVNNRSISNKRISSGDELRFGDVVLEIREEGAEWFLIHRVPAPSEISATPLVDRTRLGVFDIRSYLPSMRRTSILFVLLTVFGAIYLWQGGYRYRYTTGPTSHAHRFIAEDCTACHTEEVRYDLTQSSIDNDSCTSCHLLSNHGEELVADAHSNISCVSCHLEHSGDSGLIVADNRECLSCHASLNIKHPTTEVENVSSYNNHPAFSIPASDVSKLKFNHQAHLASEVIGPDGYVSLNCSSCHGRSSYEQGMEKIVYENSCMECHSLGFDELFPNTEAPHAKTDIVYAFLSNKLKDLGSVPLKLQTNDQKRVRPGSSTEVESNQIIVSDPRELEKELFANRGCVLCHEMEERGEYLESESAYDVVRPRMKNTWFAHGLFDHNPHEFVSCESCHEGIMESESATDVNIPGIETCQSCHMEGLNASSTCISCHSFHDNLPMPGEKKQDIKKFQNQ